MTKELDTTFIQIVHPVCCGLDVGCPKRYETFPSFWL